MKIGYVCTNYNNSMFTRKAIASLCAGTRPADVRIVVVDNNSREEDVAALLEVGSQFPHVDIILSPENIGYFPGLNAGIARLRQTHQEIAVMVVGNNDLEFPPDFIERLQTRAQILETWAVVSPDLVCQDGSHQNPHVLHPISRTRRLVWDLYYRWYPSAFVIRQLAGLTRRLTARAETLAGHGLHRVSGPIIMGLGACYILGPLFFRNFERLYAPVFLMGEEFFLAEQLKLIGQSVYYDPRFVVFHHGAATTDEVPSRRLWKMSQQSHRFYRRYLAMSSTERRDVVSDGSGKRI